MEISIESLVEMIGLLNVSQVSKILACCSCWLFLISEDQLTAVELGRPTVWRMPRTITRFPEINVSLHPIV